ncbi:hypothetical transcript [Echinococcus multilocularis]|uniref:Hypothetical transcript n=1 Tax=Echinococcus multilocularis TaxID=6211 RepID=A0A0S4MM40_ECHMU|nr:hypothetical transcript [Echinococcus multilocularis]
MSHRLGRSRRHSQDTYSDVRASLANKTSWRDEDFVDFTHIQPVDWLVSASSQTESEESRRISQFQLPPEPYDGTKLRLFSSFPSNEDEHLGFALITSRESEPEDDYNEPNFRTTRREIVGLSPMQILRRWTTIVNLSGLKREGDKVTLRPEAANEGLFLSCVLMAISVNNLHLIHDSRVCYRRITVPTSRGGGRYGLVLFIDFGVKGGLHSFFLLFISWTKICLVPKYLIRCQILYDYKSLRT